MDNNYHDDLTAIGDGLAAAMAHRAELAQALAALEAAGIYPAMPAEQMQDRGGAGQYLYMIFRLGPDGEYEGPDHKRKVYVGNDPARIAEARRLAANRKKWDMVSRAARDLDGWIAAQRRELSSLARTCDRWPTFDLGQVGPAAAGTPGPKSGG